MSIFDFKHMDKQQRTRVKMGVLIAIIAIGLIWILISLTGGSRARTREPQSQQWTMAHDATSKLREDPQFKDVDIIPADNDKSRYKVVGSVQKKESLDSLNARLPQLLTGGSYDVDVMVLNPG